MPHPRCDRERSRKRKKKRDNLFDARPTSFLQKLVYHRICLCVSYIFDPGHFAMHFFLRIARRKLYANFIDGRSSICRIERPRGHPRAALPSSSSELLQACSTPPQKHSPVPQKLVLFAVLCFAGDFLSGSNRSRYVQDQVQGIRMARASVRQLQQRQQQPVVF